MMTFGILPVAVQEQSMTSKATDGLFKTDVDSFLQVTNQEKIV
jgi:hypothetical protein